MRFFRSLLAKYMLIILFALVFIQASYLIMALLAQGIDSANQKGALDESTIEKAWHKDASDLKAPSSHTVRKIFSNWKKQYPDAGMFWVDEKGKLVEEVDAKETLPAQWTSTTTVKFIKSRYGGDPFTVIAFVGDDESNGFIVLELPRAVFNPPVAVAYEKYGNILSIGILLMISLFIVISFLFFRGIRKRLLHLQEAMSIRDVDGLPVQTTVKKMDEIGQLEQSFNGMIVELKESKQREQKEERIRRELIASLSHDLRTPLTKIRAQTYTLGKEPLSKEGEQAVKAIESSIVNIDRLMENLMSYTLLMASKYKFNQKEIEVVRFIREQSATWYSVFEKEGFEIDIDLQSFKNKWNVDPIWLERILDNLFQNVVRHAKNGQYIGIKTESTETYDAIIISDHGNGMKNESNEKGAGIGLTIVDMMVKGMKLDWELESSEAGTIIKIKRCI